MAKWFRKQTKSQKLKLFFLNKNLYSEKLDPKNQTYSESMDSSIINDDQSGYLKGCFIGQNIRILEDVSFFTKENNLPGISLSIDFEKAFDPLNWNFIFKTLKYINFGESFIGFVRTMYNNIQSAVLNNGNTGNYFNLQRGVRQGCPL